MRRPGVLHNHQSTHARPDEQVGRSRGYVELSGRHRGERRRRRYTSGVLDVLKRSARKKRRQRDRTATEDET